MLYRALQKITSKRPRDFIIHAKRKLFLSNVKRMHAKHGVKYFFSNTYLKKHIEVTQHIDTINLFENANPGLFGDILKLKSRLADSAVINEIVFFADRALLHQFDLLGSGLTEVNYPAKATGIIDTFYQWELYGQPKTSKLTHASYKVIDWHIDFKSGYRWDVSRYYPEARSYVNIFAADIKVPWELSRCQHMPMLGLAYLATDKDIYAQEIYSQILDWIENNPLCMGPNWNCPMDVGIRVANWLVALELIQHYKHESNQTRHKIIVASLVQHIDYLWNNFEWTSRLTSNHYLSDLAGFLFCVVYIPNLKSKKTFTKFIKDEFETEIQKQMYHDGMNSEGSLPYHRLVMELFAYSAILADKNNIPFSLCFYQQLTRSFEFTGAVMRSDGGMPQIGDNDGGIFLKFFPRSLTDFSYLNSLSQIVCEKKFSDASHTGMIEHVMFDHAPKELRIDEPVFRCFKKAGISIIKDKELYFSFYHGLNGQKGNGGHCHNDRLSFTLAYRNKDIFIDPGSGLYTPSSTIRNQFRSTMSHNTVAVNSKEQNRFYENGYLFGIKEDITSVYSNTILGEEKISIDAQHDGYQRGGLNALHKRKVEISRPNKEIIIQDVVESKKKQPSTLIFILKKHSDFEISKTQGGFITKDVEVVCSSYRDIIFENMGISPSYGVIENDAAVRVLISFEHSVKTTIRLRD